MPPKKAKVAEKHHVLEKEVELGDDNKNDSSTPHDNPPPPPTPPPPPPPTTTSSSSSAVKAKIRHDIVKCAECKSRGARRGCTQFRCLVCCTDQDCEAHALSRGRASYHDDLLKGNTEIMRFATQMRSRIVVPNRYRESGFVFTHQTIKLWDIREFLSNAKWKEDAVRKAQKRMLRRQQEEKQEESNPTTTTKMTTTTTTTTPSTPRLKISRKRFHSVMEDLYQKSLES